MMANLFQRWGQLSPGRRIGLLGTGLTVLAFVTLPFLDINLTRLFREAMGDELAFFFPNLPEVRLRLSYLETMVGLSYLLKLLQSFMEALDVFGLRTEDLEIGYWALTTWMWFLRLNLLFFMFGHGWFVFQALSLPTSALSNRERVWMPFFLGMAQFVIAGLFLLGWRGDAGAGLWLIWLASGLLIADGLWHMKEQEIGLFSPEQKARWSALRRQVGTFSSAGSFSRPQEHPWGMPSPPMPGGKTPAQDAHVPMAPPVPAAPPLPGSDLTAPEPPPIPRRAPTAREHEAGLSDPDEATRIYGLEEGGETRPPQAWLQSAEGFTYLLRGTVVTIGRAEDNTLQLRHPSVSKHHARIVYQEGRFWLEDLNSTNGTEVNGQRFRGRRVPLESGASIRFGVLPPLRFYVE